MDAIITAGGRLKAEDPLFEATSVEKKALIPMAGKPMVGWVLDALRGSGVVDNIVVVGLRPEELNSRHDNLCFLDSQGGLIDNLFAGMYKLQELDPQLKKFLVFSSDIPLVTPEIVRGFVEECGDQSADLYYSVVEEKTMEARFPHSNRTYVPLKGGRYSGGDAFLIDVVAASGNVDLARELVGKRKSTFAQLRLAGFGFILRFLLRRVTIQEAAAHAASKAGFDGRAVDTKFAELAMDVDKLNQYEMIKAELEALVASSA
jgi:GTP:adenosylcobinamide-phosphate guanylyltransferase